MFGVGGVSAIGTAVADAPPTSEKVNPTAPKAGTAFVIRFRFEACFTPGIVHLHTCRKTRFEYGKF